MVQPQTQPNYIVPPPNSTPVPPPQPQPQTFQQSGSIQPAQQMESNGKGPMLSENGMGLIIPPNPQPSL